MDKRIKRRWINALRSGKYEQGRRQLAVSGMDNNTLYCCLGVLCELAVESKVIAAYDPEHGSLPDAVSEWANIEQFGNYGGKRTLAGYNDSGRSFKQIANIIERHF